MRFTTILFWISCATTGISGGVFTRVSHDAGFGVLLAASTLGVVSLIYENYRDRMKAIDTEYKLRARLIDLHDWDYLDSLKDDR